MKKILKVSLILSLLVTSLFAGTMEEKQEKAKKEEMLIKLRELDTKKESVDEVLKRFSKDGEKKSKTDDVLNGNTGFKF
jgi:hypothetical protein